MRPMTYCVGIYTAEGLVMAADSRTNAGNDQVNVCRKMHTFVQEGERCFVLLTSGSLSLRFSTAPQTRYAPACATRPPIGGGAAMGHCEMPAARRWWTDD